MLCWYRADLPEYDSAVFSAGVKFTGLQLAQMLMVRELHTVRLPRSRKVLRRRGDLSHRLRKMKTQTHQDTGEHFQNP